MLRRFLLTKQWSKINYTQKHAIQLSLFVKMKRWAERAKEKVSCIITARVAMRAKVMFSQASVCSTLLGAGGVT